MKLMVAEEDMPGHDLEHLQFAEVRTAKTRERAQFRGYRPVNRAFCRHIGRRVNPSCS